MLSKIQFWNSQCCHPSLYHLLQRQKKDTTVNIFIYQKKNLHPGFSPLIVLFFFFFFFFLVFHNHNKNCTNFSPLFSSLCKKKKKERAYHILTCFLTWRYLEIKKTTKKKEKNQYLFFFLRDGLSWKQCKYSPVSTNRNTEGSEVFCPDLKCLHVYWPASLVVTLFITREHFSVTSACCLIWCLCESAHIRTAWWCVGKNWRARWCCHSHHLSHFHKSRWIELHLWRWKRGGMVQLQMVQLLRSQG